MDKAARTSVSGRNAAPRFSNRWLLTPSAPSDPALAEWTLADGFPLTSGSVNFVLPTDVAARDDYIVVLFGDSGNASPKFSIKPAASNKASLRDDPATALTDLGSTITDAVLGADAAAPAA